MFPSGDFKISKTGMLRIAAGSRVKLIKKSKIHFFNFYLDFRVSAGNPGLTVGGAERSEG